MSEENSVNTNFEETEKPKKASTKKSSSKKASTKKSSTKKTDTQDDFLTDFNWHQYQEGIDELDEKDLFIIAPIFPAPKIIVRFFPVDLIDSVKTNFKTPL